MKMYKFPEILRNWASTNSVYEAPFLYSCTTAWEPGS